MATTSRGYVQPDSRTTTVTEAISKVGDRLSSVAWDRPGLDHYIRQGAEDVLKALEPIEEALFARATPTPQVRHKALDLLIALEGGLSGTDNRTYGVDRAKVTPLIEDMLTAIVLGKVKFETEG